MCIKSDFEEIILKLAKNMGKEKRPFCCPKLFVLNGLSAPTFEKNTHKNGKKSDFKEFFFLNWQQMDKLIRNF